MKNSGKNFKGHLLKLKIKVKLLPFLLIIPFNSTTASNLTLVLGIWENKCGRHSLNCGHQQTFAQCSDFLAKSIAVASSPTCVCTFFQFVVDCVFDALTKHHYQVNMHKKEQFDISLTYKEHNALHYTSGYYVVKAVL